MIDLMILEQILPQKGKYCFLWKFGKTIGLTEDGALQ